jgi:FixJ family two-component response regulator
MMPGLPSANVVTELKRLAPEIPIILNSGYAESEATATFPGNGLAVFLQKPYPIAMLSGVVNKALTPSE